MSQKDHFYVFDRSAFNATPANVPTRVTLSEFPKVDLIQDIVNPRTSQPQSPPLVELASEKSGLKLSFSSNRTLLSSDRLSITERKLTATDCLILFANLSSLRGCIDGMHPESGVQFYTANFVSPESSRKKIHGGSGQVGNGDGYGPAST